MFRCFSASLASAYCAHIYHFSKQKGGGGKKRKTKQVGTYALFFFVRLCEKYGISHAWKEVINMENVFGRGKKRKNILHEKITDHEVVVVVAPIPSRETGLVILRLPPVSLKVPERVRPFRDAHILRVRSTQS